MCTAIIILFISLSFTPQTYDCVSAKAHTHNALTNAVINVTSWQGCAMTGTINGTTISLFAESACCATLKAKTPGLLAIRYDQTCMQVVEARWPYTSLIPTPTPTPTVTPTPVPSPTATPVPSPTPVPTPVPTPTPGPLPCSMKVPASVSVTANAIGLIAVSLNAVVPQPLPFLVKAVSSSPGQVAVFPAQHEPMAGTSAVVQFGVRVKRRGARIDFSSPCPGGPKSTTVMVQ